MLKKIFSEIKKDLDEKKQKNKEIQAKSMQLNGSLLGKVNIDGTNISVFEKTIKIEEGWTVYVIMRSEITFLDVGVTGGVTQKSSGLRTTTGALVGGVLTGGIGLVAGAIVGNASKKKSDTRRYYLKINYTHEGIAKMFNISSKDDRGVNYLEKLLSK
jgi:hypothetical protein